MAGFELTLYGRIWVTPKEGSGASERLVLGERLSSQGG